MNSINGELVKNLRDQLNMSQEDFADKLSISTSTLYRIENNQSCIDVFRFLEIMRTFDKPMDDFFLLFLDSRGYLEYKDYQAYHNTLFVNYKFAEFLKGIKNLKDNTILDNPYIQQRLAFAKLLDHLFYRKNKPGIFNQADLNELYKIIDITIKDFDEEEVAGYLLVGYEIDLVTHLSTALSHLGEHKRAITLAKALLSNKTIKARRIMNNRDFSNICAQLYLAYSYFFAKMYNDALGVALETYWHCIRENEVSLTISLLSIIAECYKSLGEEEAYYKSSHTRAHYCSILFGYNQSVADLKLEAKGRFDRDLEEEDRDI